MTKRHGEQRLVYAMFCGMQWSKIWESEVRVQRAFGVFPSIFYYFVRVKNFRFGFRSEGLGVNGLKPKHLIDVKVYFCKCLLLQVKSLLIFQRQS